MHHLHIKFICTTSNKAESIKKEQYIWTKKVVNESTRKQEN